MHLYLTGKLLRQELNKEMLELSDTQKGRVWLTKSDVGDIVESKTEYVKDIARAMRGKGHENLKKYADDFERNALKSNRSKKRTQQDTKHKS